MGILNKKMREKSDPGAGKRAVILLLIAIIAGWNFCFIYPQNAWAETSNPEQSASHSIEPDLCSEEDFDSPRSSEGIADFQSVPAEPTPICCLSHGDDTPKAEASQKSDFENLTLATAQIGQQIFLDYSDKCYWAQSADSPPPREDVLFSVFKKE